jgi:hypothetical protein
MERRRLPMHQANFLTTRLSITQKVYTEICRDENPFRWSGWALMVDDAIMWGTVNELGEK